MLWQKHSNRGRLCVRGVCVRVSIRRVSGLLVSLCGEVGFTIFMRSLQISHSVPYRNHGLLSSNGRYLWPAQAAHPWTRRCSRRVAWIGAHAPSCLPHIGSLGRSESASRVGMMTAAARSRLRACECIGVPVGVGAQR